MLVPEPVIQEFLRVVPIHNPPLGEREMAHFLEGEFVAMGGRAEYDDAHRHFGGNCGNLIITFRGNDSLGCGAGIILAAHLDSLVAPGQKGVTPRLEGGFIGASGGQFLGADDKAGIAAILSGVRQFIAAHPHHPTFQVLLTVAEEGGLLGARHLDHRKLLGDRIFLFDADDPVGTIIHGGAACDRIEAEPVAVGTDDRALAANPWHLFSNPARGLAVRPPNSSARRHLRVIRGTGGGPTAKPIVRKHRLFHPFLVSPGSAIARLARNGCAGIKVAPRFRVTNGLADSHILNRQGFATLNFGLGIENPHTPRERIAIADLFKGAGLVYSLLREARNG